MACSGPCADDLPPTAQHPTPQVAGNGLLTGQCDWDFRSERVLQTYEPPAAAFLDANPNLDLSNITAIVVNFDGQIAGAVIIDELGLRN